MNKSKIMKETMIPDVVRILEKHYGVTTMSQWGIYDYIRRYENESPEEIAYRIYDDLYNFDKSSKSTKKSKMKKTGDLPRAGDVYTNDYGGSCKIISVDEPSLSNEYQLDNFQIAYQMGDSYPVCHKWKDVKAMLELNGYNYQASTKKSYTPNYQDFRSMVGSIRNTGNHNKVFKE